MTADQFIASWRYGDLIRIDGSALKALNIPARSHEFLRGAGLPASIPMDQSRRLTLLPSIQVGVGSLFDCVGENAYRALYRSDREIVNAGGLLCLEEGTGSVVWCYPDGAPSTFVNSSVEQFAASATAFCELLEARDEIEDQEALLALYQQFRRRLYVADRRALRSLFYYWPGEIQAYHECDVD
ncbi:hypothetical protein CCAX7_55850 [Capsulimonas corticalis]|uniref:Uncharacterized protein n=1 Tax=Capsulimonas corticalis TaxID=2219043 RepID=A0A402D0U7_9BACT|nr:SUKH-4 family immunity protein [Capsulimonas corticalis]BDI33534.1 hypothetical protein CCAX7_55850 [Capsulimonas corticalis]